MCARAETKKHGRVDRAMKLRAATSLFLQSSFDVDRHFNLVAQHSLPGGNAEIVSVERGRGLPAGEHFALHAGAKAEQLRFEHDLFRDPFDREIAGDVER